MQPELIFVLKKKLEGGLKTTGNTVSAPWKQSSPVRV